MEDKDCGCTATIYRMPNLDSVLVGATLVAGLKIEHCDRHSEANVLKLEQERDALAGELAGLREYVELWPLELQSQDKFNAAFVDKLKEFGTIDRLVEEYSSMKMQLRKARGVIEASAVTDDSHLEHSVRIPDRAFKELQSALQETP